jgi:hypothetical protein
MDGADVRAFGDDGLGGELAHLELGPLSSQDAYFFFFPPTNGFLAA